MQEDQGKEEKTPLISHHCFHCRVLERKGSNLQGDIPSHGSEVGIIEGLENLFQDSVRDGLSSDLAKRRWLATRVTGVPHRVSLNMPASASALPALRLACPLHNDGHRRCALDFLFISLRWLVLTGVDDQSYGRATFGTVLSKNLNQLRFLFVCKPSQTPDEQLRLERRQ